MPDEPQKVEIDHRTLKLIVGVVALSLPSLTSLLAPSPIASISASYYAGGWSQTILIGFLFAIAAFLLAYNGLSTAEMVLSKVAALAALGVAMYPCDCGSNPDVVPYVHGLSAAAMFLILAVFCLIFRRRALGKGHPEAGRRARIYAACSLAILLAIVLLAVDNFTGDALTQRFPRFVFVWEAVGLVAFGASWLTASRVLPALARSDERLFSKDDQERT